MEIQFPGKIWWKDSSFLINWSWHPNWSAENQLTKNVKIYFYTLNSIPIIDISILIVVLCYLNYYSFTVSVELGSVISPTMFFFKTVWLFLFLINPYEFYNYCKKKKTLDFDRDYTDSIGQFIKYFHLNNIKSFSLNVFPFIHVLFNLL